MRRALGVWALSTALGCVVVHAWTSIDSAAPPDDALASWAGAALDTARTGAPIPPAPADAGYQARGPVVALAFFQGKLQARHVGDQDLPKSVREAVAAFRSDPELRKLPGFRPGARNPVRFTLSVPLGSGPLFRALPMISTLGLVPLLEGIEARLGDRRALLTPDEIWASGLLDKAVVTPIPDLSFGTDLGKLIESLAQRLDVAPERLRREGTLLRFRAASLREAAYPGGAKLTPSELRRAAGQGVDFLLRHQKRTGQYTYIYDGRTGKELRTGFYNMPRHAGTTFFLARAAHALGRPDARKGALRALSWVRRDALHRCGADDRSCVSFNRPRTNVGSSALTALAAAELLRSQDNLQVRDLLTRLTAFIRSMQRPDGELMHDFIIPEQKAIDVQRMYYSGEAALALLGAHEVMADDRDLATVKRLMGHLTGAAWSFFGSRYFYGEEHWTCQAVAAAADRMDVDEGLRFCLRWEGFQRAVQYRKGQTPWVASGAYGVGPLLLPRITAVASRVEAGVPIYRLARDRGLPTAELRAQLQRSVELLMRMRWAPGPTHLLFDPRAALGGIPGTQADLLVRNDFVQHAGAALLAWADVLEEEASP